MRSFRTRLTDRRKAYLSLASQIESQLREAYDKRFHEKKTTQSSLAQKLGIHRSAVNRRLTGRSNMTVETLADMVWALGQRIRVSIYDPVGDQDGARFPAQTEKYDINDTAQFTPETTLSAFEQVKGVALKSKNPLPLASAT